MSEQPFTYKFRRSGGQLAPHCTYCKFGQHETCTFPCQQRYEEVQAERAKDGVIVNDEP